MNHNGLSEHDGNVTSSQWDFKVKISNPREARDGKRRVIKLWLVLHVIVIDYGASFLDQLERRWGKIITIHDLYFRL